MIFDTSQALLWNTRRGSYSRSMPFLGIRHARMDLAKFTWASQSESAVIGASDGNMLSASTSICAQVVSQDPRCTTNIINYVWDYFRYELGFALPGTSPSLYLSPKLCLPLFSPISVNGSLQKYTRLSFSIIFNSHNGIASVSNFGQ